MTNRLAELLEAIRERPDDDALRLVYADALEEAGETIRAEYIRCALNDDEPQREILERHHHAALTGPVVTEYAEKVAFERGLVSRVEIMSSMLAHTAALLDTGAVRTLRISIRRNSHRPRREDGAALGAVSALRYITELTVPLASEFLGELLFSPHLDRVAMLDLVSWRREDEDDQVPSLEIIGHAPLPGLRKIRLKGGGSRDDATLPALAARRGLKTFHFNVRTPGIADTAFELIAASPALHDLEELGCWGVGFRSRITASAFRALANAPGLRALREFWLSILTIDDDALATFAELNQFRLRRLRLTFCSLQTLDPVLRSPACSLLEELDVSKNELDDRVVEALARWPGAANLRVLVMTENRLTAAGWTLLRTAPALAKCNIIGEP